MKAKTYVIAAGGTSGHINPAIAIADEIRRNEPDSRIIFCGTENGIENTLIPQSGYELFHIEAIGFPKRISKKLFMAIYSFFKGRSQSKILLNREKSDVVIGTGGYVCGPIVSMASSLGIPTLLHEQNAFPGKANRFLSRHADVVCVSFPDTEEKFKKAKKTVLTGNPVREVFYNLTKAQARKILEIGESEKIVFATGGSLGAKTINTVVFDLVKTYPKPDYRFILSCGKLNYPVLSKAVEGYKDMINLKEYLFDQHLYLAAADIVLCRAGALTCSEIAMLAKASIMVPYPYAAGDHQTYNAKAFSDIGASILIKDSEMDAKSLYSHLNRLFENPKQIVSMEKLSGSLALPDATKLIYSEIAILSSKKKT